MVADLMHCEGTTLLSVVRTECPSLSESEAARCSRLRVKWEKERESQKEEKRFSHEELRFYDQLFDDEESLKINHASKREEQQVTSSAKDVENKNILPSCKRRRGYRKIVLMDHIEGD